MIRASLALLLAIAVGVLASNTALAEQPTATVQIVPDGELTVGDPVEVRIRLTHESGDRVLMDTAVVQMGGMEPSAPLITEISPTETLVVFQTRSFTTGTFEVELPSISLQLADQSLTDVSLRPLSISVTSVLTDDSAPRPLTAPDLLEGQERTFTPWIVAIIGIAVGFILARFIRQRRNAAAAVGPVPESSGIAHERAALGLDESLQAAEQCRQLASAVRARIAAEWSLPASALTASEIGPALAAAGAPGAVVLRTTRLLEACDRVQFGGEEPTQERLRGYLQLAEAIWSEGSNGAAT
ncbi:MAG: hypothetical protein OXN86_08645 [Chloroflexota bacterium]|nr:hypothetical protein [Chloroflexota bacterium]